MQRCVQATICGHRAKDGYHQICTSPVCCVGPPCPSLTATLCPESELPIGGHSHDYVHDSQANETVMCVGVGGPSDEFIQCLCHL